MSHFVDEPDDFIDAEGVVDPAMVEAWLRGWEPEDLDADAWIDWGGEG